LRAAFLLLGGQRLTAVLTHAHTHISFALAPYSGRATCWAHQNHIGNLNWRFLLGDSTLGALAGLARNRLLHYAYMLDQQRSFVGKNPQHASSLAAVGAREHLYRVVAMNQ